MDGNDFLDVQNVGYFVFVILFARFFFCHSRGIIAYKETFVKYFAGCFCEIFYKNIEIISIESGKEKSYNI